MAPTQGPWEHMVKSIEYQYTTNLEDYVDTLYKLLATLYQIAIIIVR